MVVEKERGQYNMELMNTSGGKQFLSVVFGGFIRRWAQIKSSIQRVNHQDSKAQSKPERGVRRFIQRRTAEYAADQLRLSGSFALPFNVSTLISRGLEQKRAFSAPFLTLNHLDFSVLTEKLPVFLFCNVNDWRRTEGVYPREFVT